jgi:CRP/FNR family transcriptional regulator, cyclic AMP receptor protein
LASPTGVPTITLKNLPIFEALSDDRLQPLARASTLQRVDKNVVLMREGDSTENVYFVLRGHLRVLVSDPDGREVILSILGPGELFGEMGVIDGHSRSATVVTADASELIVIAKADFKSCLAENFDISLSIMRSLVHRLRAADRAIESLALLDVYGRVARLLLEMAEEGGPDGRRLIARKITKQDMAKMVGASREMVSRVMKDLARQGLVEEVDGRLVLCEKPSILS